jgi:hypothetical protein
MKGIEGNSKIGRGIWKAPPGCFGSFKIFKTAQIVPELAYRFS